MEDAILERIRKLLALARDNPNPHEAEAAAAMANRLMLKHSIDESKVRDNPVNPHAGFKRHVYTTGKFAAWEASLLLYITRANLCSTIKIGRDQYDILGPKDNVDVSVEMHVWLKMEIHRLAVEAYAKKDERSNYGSMDPHRFHTSFKHGAVAAVGSRLALTRQEVEAESVENSSALALITNKLAVFTKETYPHTKTTRSSAGQDASVSAYRAGHAAGSKVALKPTRMLK